MVKLDQTEFDKFLNFINKHERFHFFVHRATIKGMGVTDYINNKLKEVKSNKVKEIYYSWVSQERPEPFRRSFFNTRSKSSLVTPSMPGHRTRSSSTGDGITKRKKRRKPRKKKSVKKRKGKSKKKRVRTGRKSRRRS